MKNTLEDHRNKASAAKAVLEKAIKREEEARKEAELLEQGKEEEAAKLASEAEAADGVQVEEQDTSSIDEKRKALPKEAKYLYKYLGVNPAGGQIVNILQTIKMDSNRTKNLVVLCLHGFGLANIGEDFARTYLDLGWCKNAAKAKISAKGINSASKDKLTGAMNKLKGGCLIIENAGLVRPDKFKEIIELCAPEKSDVKIILTGEKVALSNMLADNMSQARHFNNRVYFDQIQEANMVDIAKGYMSEKGYKPESGMSGTIKNLLMSMETGNIDRLLKAVDDGIARAEARDPLSKKLLKADIQ